MLNNEPYKSMYDSTNEKVTVYDFPNQPEGKKPTKQVNMYSVKIYWNFCKTLASRLP